MDSVVTIELRKRSIIFEVEKGSPLILQLNRTYCFEWAAERLSEEEKNWGSKMSID